MLCEHLAPGLDPLGGQLSGDVGFERENGLGLRSITFDDDRQRLVDAGKRFLDDFLADAARKRFAPHPCEPLGK